MPTTLRARIRGSRAGTPATPAEYVLLGLAAVILLAMVFLALGRLVDHQMNCEARTDTVAASSTRC
jgi:uncharacterized membrane protein YuzA (DUF378 family)